MFNVIISDKHNQNQTIVLRNMAYVDALNIAAHLNTLNTFAAKKMGKVITTIFSVVKG